MFVKNVEMFLKKRYKQKPPHSTKAGQSLLKSIATVQLVLLLSRQHNYTTAEMINQERNGIIMKIEQLPSGKYRLRQMEKGKTYTVIVDEKPSKAKATQLMAEEIEKSKIIVEKMTFQIAAEKYVESKKNVLSPRTIRDYSKMCSRLSEWFVKKNIADITQNDINRQVNELAIDRTPKTVSNLHGFISAILGVFRPDLNISTKLPQKAKNEPYIPSDEDVKNILYHVKGTIFEIPIILGCYGMRRSEICALTPDDIEGDVVHITKALVQDINDNWIVKTTKTTSSTRDIIIPMEIADRIREQGYAYNGFPGSISNHLSKLEKELGIEHFSLHKLRHYFASKMSALGVPEADILKLGGWETDHVMKTVYRHSMIDKEKEAQRKASNQLSNVLFE